MLDHERLDVYVAARQFGVFTRNLLSRGLGRRPDLADHLLCASASIALNIAEGAGEFPNKEKTRFYRIARRSARECSAVLHQLVDWQIVTEADVADGHELLERIVALVRLILSLEMVARARRAAG